MIGQRRQGWRGRRRRAWHQRRAHVFLPRAIRFARLKLRLWLRGKDARTLFDVDPSLDEASGDEGADAVWVGRIEVPCDWVKQVASASQCRPDGGQYRVGFDLPTGWGSSLEEGDPPAACAAYKRVTKRVHPVNASDPSGSAPSRPRPSASPRQPRSIGRLTPERESLLNIAPDLLEAEKDYLLKTLRNHAAALAFDDGHLGLLSEHIEAPVAIRTVPHDPWTARTYHLSRTKYDEAIALLKLKLEQGVLEHCNGPYSNAWFLVRKPNGKYRLIQDVWRLNSVTLKDATMPTGMDEMIDRLTGYSRYTKADKQSGFDQVGLDKRSRDLTAIMTPIGLLRLTGLPQGWTGSPDTFQRIMSKILYPVKGKSADSYLGDIIIYGLDHIIHCTLGPDGMQPDIQ